MRTHAAASRPRPPLLILGAVVFVVLGSVADAATAQQTEQLIERDGLRLARHLDGTYQLSAESVTLEDLVAHLVQMTGAEFSVAPELSQQPVTIETDRIGLSALIEQLRASLAANLILASTREHRVSRVWLTATAATANGNAAPGTTTVPVGSTPVSGAQPAMPPQAMLPVPSGNETQAVGFDPAMDMGEFIRNRAAAEQGAGSVPAAGGATSTGGAPTTGGAPAPGGGPPGQPGTETGTQEQPPTTNAPPIPMDPNALETYFAGDKTTNTYHRLNCIQAMYLPAANKVWFKSRQEAIAAGYTPHEICIAR